MPLISFSLPWYLLLLPPLVWGVLWVSRQSLAGLRGSRARWSLGLRIGIVACAVLALAGLQMRQPTKRLAVLYVLDQSDSIPPEQRKRALEYVNRAADRMGPKDRKSTRLNSSHLVISYAVFCLNKEKYKARHGPPLQ